MDNIPETFGKYFNRLYKKDGYLDKYGGSVVVTAITLLIFFGIFSYFYIEHKIEPIRRDWINQRCSPAIMPWAGYINAPKGKSKIEYASENFYQCTTLVLKKVIKHFMSPIYYLTKLLQKMMQMILNAINMVRVYINFLRIKLQQIFEYLVGRMVNVTIPLRINLAKIKDMLGKVTGAMTAALYTVFGSYLALKAFIGAFLKILIIFLIVLSAVIAILWILVFSWPKAIALTIIYLIVAIPVIIVAIWMAIILNMSNKSVPPVCFDKNTIIKTQKGNIRIKNLKSGTILKNGDKVTATLKLALNDESVYNLNGIIVTGTHKVLYDKIGWIYISDHPESVKIKNYREPIVYCFSTESKRIYIDDYKFLDWDDLEPLDIMKLKNLNYLNNNSSLSEIHKKLESGILGNTMIELDNGQSVKLKNIKSQ